MAALSPSLPAGSEVSERDPAVQALLARLRSEPRQPGEARFVYFEHQFRRPAVKVLPGEYFVHDAPLVVLTTLGSCIATCLWDPLARVAGMNHFMLPDGDETQAGAGSGRYGSFAMELLINAMMKRGAARTRLQAKVFGGATVIEGMHSLNVGERNTRFVTGYLQTEGIPVLAQDVLTVHPRRICLFTDSGEVKVKRLPPARAAEVVSQEQDIARRAATPPTPAAGSVDLF